VKAAARERLDRLVEPYPADLDEQVDGVEVGAAAVAVKVRRPLGVGCRVEVGRRGALGVDGTVEQPDALARLLGPEAEAPGRGQDVRLAPDLG
jgi:hypothetical protein